MTENSIKVPVDSKMIYDVCVIGSGPAGIITALEYSALNPSKTVIIVEFGDKNIGAKNHLDQTITIDNLVNHHVPEECTNKGFGGTSATWGGRCVMYDAVDFTKRAVLNGHCTWEKELFDEVQQYLQKTANYFECGKAEFNLNNIPGIQKKRIAENFVEGEVTDSWLERWSMPTRFGKRYLREVADRANITLLEGFEARTFTTERKAGIVTSLTIRHSGSAKEQTIQAHTFVLAAGAQETTRILLRNQHLFDSLGSTPAALGKYYQSHLSGKIASVKFSGDPKKTDYGFVRDEDGTYVRRRLQFSSKLLQENNLLNAAIWLDNPLYFDPKHKSGSMSFMYMAMLVPFLRKRLAPPAIAHSITKGKVQGLKRHLLNIVKGLPGSLSTPASIFFERYLVARKLPGVFLYSPSNTYALHFHTEQIPVERNMMKLGADNESLEINYELTDDDIESIIRLHEILDDHLRKCNCGHLEYWFEKKDLKEAIRAMSKDGIHQSGTTRIAASGNEGVVDNDLKVWGTQNVFVCSSSVFPTSGQANPTFFLGAFAVRLANHLTNKDANS